MRVFFAGFEAEEHMEEDGMVQRLRELERSLREEHHIESTLRERLDDAVAREDYETAARLRDALRQRD
jgi:protein-arginine kinase activator protein McsA